jgi:general stress protein YciG
MTAHEGEVMTGKKKQGFAVMSVEQRKRIASMGGVAAHKTGFAHEFTSDEARAAGRKGGLMKGVNARKAATA